ncbi:MAG: 16S rRNA (guanine(527)-N(7))-methyltransferase RsmG [Gammaproteobacteria bacterium]|nr:16S rRNA (guanine(527)-N(7))-methyltransferase RsmG [Gammaproteobacteria bacterium]
MDGAQPAAERLRAGLDALGLALAPEACARLLAYLELLAKWNRAYNLTAVRDPAEMVPRHLLDSLSIAHLIEGRRVADVGTGPGLPGIPLAIAQPDRHFVLIDSNAKKTRFVFQALSELGVANAEVVRQRVETYRPRRPFDTVLARAFAPLDRLLGAVAHLCAPGARVVAMRGARPEGELEGLPAGFELRGVEPLRVPGLEGERCALLIARTGGRGQDKGP